MAATTTRTKKDPHLDHAIQLADAEELVNDLVEAVDDARNHVDEVRSRIQAGDPEVTPTDLANAVAGVEYATLRQHGAWLKLYQTKKAKPYRPVVAETVATALTEAYGFPFTAVDKVPTEKRDGTAPQGYVVQNKGAERGWGGPDSPTSPLSAPLAITLHRHGVSYVKGLDGVRVADALEQADLSVRRVGLEHVSDATRVTFEASAHLPHDDIKPSMLAPDLSGGAPSSPRLVFDVAESEGVGAMYR